MARTIKRNAGDRDNTLRRDYRYEDTHTLKEEIVRLRKELEELNQPASPPEPNPWPQDHDD